MVKPVFRRKSIGTKVSEEEYAQLEALAGGRAMSEWAREVLLRELDGRQARPAEQTLLAEVLALRTILLNLHFTDLTGPFCTSRREREFTRRTAGYAKQEVQGRTDRDVTASDRSRNCERKAHSASL